MVGMLCGVTIFAYVTSTVSSLLTTFNTQNIRTQEQQRNIDGFCRSHQIPKPLARKMSGFYDYVLPRQIHSEDKDIISGLPETLQQQVRASSLILRGVPTVAMCCGQRPPLARLQVPGTVAVIRLHAARKFCDNSLFHSIARNVGVIVHLHVGLLSQRVLVIARNRLPGTSTCR